MANRRAKPTQTATPRSDRRIREASAEIFRVIRTVTLDEITALDEVQVRVNGLDEQRVEQYVEFLLAGGAFKDPLDLFEDETGRLILGAGWHRREAYRRALARFTPNMEVPELAPLQAELHPGGLEAAIDWAEEDNLAHGLELSPRDKRNILERRLKRGHEWAMLSNRVLAAKLGVHHDTIAAWRREIESTGGFPPVERVGADGKVRDTTAIAASNQLRAARDALAKLDLPALDEAWRDTIKRALYSGEDHLERETFGLGSRLRAYLPYALQIELDSDEPRVSLVNWLRGQLAAWVQEQAAGAEYSAPDPRTAHEQREKGKTEQANDRTAAKIYELQSAVLAVVEGQMTYREIEFAVNAYLGRIANPGLLSGAINSMTHDGRLRNVGGGRYALPGAPVPTPNRSEPPLPPVSDDHDEALDAAYRTVAVFGQAVMQADESIRKLFEIRGIRALYALPPERMKQVYGDVSDLRYLAEELATYCDQQLKKLRLMSRTGQPYDEDGEA